MSTGADCRFIEVEPGRWTYWLQDYPYGYTEEGETYGPFSSFRRAEDHLHANHANPGGHSTQVHDQHVHEWKTGDGWAPVGVDVSIRVDSLGPAPDPAELMALIASLPPDHPAIRINQRDGLVPNITRCEACYKTKEEVER